VLSVPPENIVVDGSVSIASYKPKTEMDYGTLLCWGDNELGRQAVPCVFHIIPAGKIIFVAYSVFQGFSKAKSANGGSIFKLELIFDTAPAASKNKARFKSGQSRLKNNHLTT
jgi:hypothetical protein